MGIISRSNRASNGGGGLSFALFLPAQGTAGGSRGGKRNSLWGRVVPLGPDEWFCPSLWDLLEVRTSLSGFNHKREMGLLPFSEMLSNSSPLCSASLGDQRKRKGQALHPVSSYFLALNGALHPKPSPGCSFPAFSVPIIMLPTGSGRTGKGLLVTVLSFTERRQVGVSPQT